MADVVYNSAKVKLGTALIDWENDNIKVALLTEDYTPDIDAHEFFDDVSADEASGTGYTAGGATIANCAVTQDDANDRAVYDGDDVVWSEATVEAKYAAVYKFSGDPATSELICLKDFGSTKSSTNSNFSVLWNAAGVFTLT